MPPDQFLVADRWMGKANRGAIGKLAVWKTEYACGDKRLCAVAGIQPPGAQRHARAAGHQSTRLTLRRLGAPSREKSNTYLLVRHLHLLESN